MCTVLSAGPGRLDPRSAPQGTYFAHYQGREIPVYGPHSVYPSGLPYFTVLDGAAGKYILAGDLDWVKKPSLRDRLTRSAIRNSPSWAAAQEPWAA